LQQETTVKLALAAALILLAAFSGCIDSPGDGVKVITLGASDCLGHVADFSGSGPTRDGRIKPEAVAPGVDVVAAVPPNLEGPDYVDRYYARSSGTSLSTPVAAGVAALLLQRDPTLTPAGVKAALTGGARKLNNSLGEQYEPYYQGAGLLDAGRSMSLLGPDLCGVVPDRWTAGRWAFLSGGKSVSPGIEVGADRPQKKIYALSPLDEDWTSRFVFFTNRERKDLRVTAEGDVADWLTVMPLPATIAANGQKVFGATLNVPNATPAGSYRGFIQISEAGKEILSVPVVVEVAEPFVQQDGLGQMQGSIGPLEWHYFYLDVPLGSRLLEASLEWSGSADLDLFLLAPTSEYYTAGDGDAEFVSIENPSSGRWLLAVHGRALSDAEKYVLQVTQSVLRVRPGSWNLGAILPGEVRNGSFLLSNGGVALTDLSYSGGVDNATSVMVQGSIEDGRIWERAIEIPAGTSRLALQLTWPGEYSDLDLKLYDPSSDLAAKSEGFKNSENLEVFDPNPGRWVVHVLGYDVRGGRPQTFDLGVTRSIRGLWPWINATGPSSLPAGQSAWINVSMQVPRSGSLQDVQGYLEIRSPVQTHQIPVLFTIAGAQIEGINPPTMQDLGGDGLLDRIQMGVSVNAVLPGSYRVEGGLLDCRGSLVKWLSNTSSLSGAGTIELDAGGKEIWRNAACGPLHLGELVLFNPDGEFIGRFQADMTIDRAPGDFQPPAAYFNGTFVNLSMETGGVISRVVVGAGVSVLDMGSYRVKASLQDKDGVEMAIYDRTLDLSRGNHTALLEFNPAKASMLAKTARLYVRDLSISRAGQEVDRIDEAWSSGSMTFRS